MWGSVCVGVVAVVFVVFVAIKAVIANLPVIWEIKHRQIIGHLPDGYSIPHPTAFIAHRGFVVPVAPQRALTAPLAQQ